MARLNPPMEVDGLRWDAVEFRTGYKEGSLPQVWNAFYTPRRKDGEWSQKQVRVWSPDTMTGREQQKVAIPPQVVLAALYAWLDDNAKSAERIADERGLIQLAIARMERDS